MRGVSSTRVQQPYVKRPFPRAFPAGAQPSFSVKYACQTAVCPTVTGYNPEVSRRVYQSGGLGTRRHHDGRDSGQFRAPSKHCIFQ